MKAKSISPGVYVDANGGYWARPCIARRYTWRRLKAKTQRDAIKENANANWNSEAGSFAQLAQLYIDAGCPNKKLEARGPEFCDPEEFRIKQLVKFFGPIEASTLRLVNLPAYKKWRIRHRRQGTGERAVDKDLQTLSNVLNYGVAIGHLEINYIRAGRPRYRHAHSVRHAREVMPASADVISQLAETFFTSVRSEVFAWQTYFAAFTGCRCSELLRLRMDAKTTSEPGYIGTSPQGAGYLFLGRRSKSGVNPWVIIGPDFAQMLECFQRWHATRFGAGARRSSPWFFPGRNGVDRVDPGAFGHALTRATEDLKLPHITPHGFRAFYVTKRRSDGVSDTIIAGEIGDQTVELLQTTYGARPENWTGGQALTWLPTTGLPAWLRWQDPQKKVVNIV